MAGPDLDPATAASLGKLFAGLAQNPKTRRMVAKAVREVMPDSPEARSFSDVEQEERFDSFKAEQEARELQRQQDEVVGRMNGQRQRLLGGGEDGEGRKYSEDDVKAIEALMQKKGITDYNDGAILYAATLPPDNPKPGDGPHEVHGTTWEFPEWGKFGKDPVRASRETANTVISELMRKRR
jgi:hypothetical protein